MLTNTIAITQLSSVSSTNLAYWQCTHRDRDTGVHIKSILSLRSSFRSYKYRPGRTYTSQLLYPWAHLGGVQPPKWISPCDKRLKIHKIRQKSVEPRNPKASFWRLSRGLYLSRGSTTAAGSPAAPMRQVPTGEFPGRVMWRRWQWMYCSV